MATTHPPAWLQGDARAEWVRVAEALADRLPRIDQLVLERHAVAYAAWREAEAELVATGRVIVLRDDKGNVKSAGASPWIAISDKARQELAATSAAMRL